MPRGRKNVAASKPTTKSASARRARGGPRARELRLDPQPERAGDGVDPGLVRQLRERQDEHERERGDRADRGRDARPRKAGGEPPHEGHEPQRHEVEAVAVVEPVVAPRRAREGRDDEQPRHVGRGEQADERGRRGASPPDRRARAPRARSGRRQPARPRGRRRSRRGGRRTTWRPRTGRSRARAPSTRRTCPWPSFRRRAVRRTRARRAPPAARWARTARGRRATAAASRVRAARDRQARRPR